MAAARAAVAAPRAVPMRATAVRAVGAAARVPNGARPVPTSTTKSRSRAPRSLRWSASFGRDVQPRTIRERRATTMLVARGQPAALPLEDGPIATFKPWREFGGEVLPVLDQCIVDHGPLGREARDRDVGRVAERLLGRAPCDLLRPPEIAPARRASAHCEGQGIDLVDHDDGGSGGTARAQE